MHADFEFSIQNCKTGNGLTGATGLNVGSVSEVDVPVGPGGVGGSDASTSDSRRQLFVNLPQDEYPRHERETYSQWSSAN